jgi:hypothetical protein
LRNEYKAIDEASDGLERQIKEYEDRYINSLKAEVSRIHDRQLEIKATLADNPDAYVYVDIPAYREWYSDNERDAFPNFHIWGGNKLFILWSWERDGLEWDYLYYVNKPHVGIGVPKQFVHPMKELETNGA